MGHAVEMAEASKVTLRIRSKDVPYINSAKEYAEMGLVPKGAHNNRDFFGKRISISENVPLFLKDIFYDPQTSGGLLISASKEASEKILSRLKGAPVDYSCVGEVEEYSGKRVLVD